MGDKSIGVTTFYQPGVSEIDNEIENENESVSVSDSSSNGGKKKKKQGAKKQKKVEDQQPKIVYDGSNDSKSIASFESEDGIESNSEGEEDHSEKMSPVADFDKQIKPKGAASPKKQLNKR